MAEGCEGLETKQGALSPRRREGGDEGGAAAAAAALTEAGLTSRSGRPKSPSDKQSLHITLLPGSYLMCRLPFLSLSLSFPSTVFPSLLFSLHFFLSVCRPFILSATQSLACLFMQLP